jgi:chemotaxis response regulator CheB
MIKKYNPDVLTLDVEMPKMDGISFLKNLMRLRPMPVVMISTLTQKGSPITLEALEIGAKYIVATLLTGMGSDGAKGLLALKQQGAYTLAQDEFSSVVWGMPKVAIDIGAANEVVPLDKITQRLLNQVIKK